VQQPEGSRSAQPYQLQHRYSRWNNLSRISIIPVDYQFDKLLQSP